MTDTPPISRVPGPSMQIGEPDGAHRAPVMRGGHVVVHRSVVLISWCGRVYARRITPKGPYAGFCLHPARILLFLAYHSTDGLDPERSIARILGVPDGVLLVYGA